MKSENLLNYLEYQSIFSTNEKLKSRDTMAFVIKIPVVINKASCLSNMCFYFRLPLKGMKELFRTNQKLLRKIQEYMYLGQLATSLTVLLFSRIEYFCNVVFPFMVVDLIILTYKGKCYLLGVHFFLLSSCSVMPSVDPHWHKISITRNYSFLQFFSQFVIKD